MRKIAFLGVLLTAVLLNTACDRTKADETAAVATEVPTTEETTTQAEVIIEETYTENDIQFYRGRRRDSIYTNDVFNIRFDAPANGYKMLSRNDVALLRDIFVNDMNSESVTNQFENDNIYLDIFATSEDGLSDVNVIIQRMSTSFENETDLERVAAILQEQYESRGLVNVKVESTRARFKGMDTIGMSSTDTGGDYTVYHKQIYIKSGDYMAIITANGDSEERAQQALDMFTTAE